MTKRLLSVLLSIVLLLGTVSGLELTAFADGKKDTHFVIYDYSVTVDVGQTAKFRGILYDYDSKYISGAEITAVCGDITVSTTTESTGYFELSLTPDTAGTFSVEISYAGNDLYNPVSDSLTLKVLSRTNYNVSYEMPAAVKSGEDLTVTVNVKDKDGLPMQSVTVNLELSLGSGVYRFKQASTDSNGNVTISIKAEGENRKAEIRVSVNGNNDYYNFRESSDIYITDGVAYRITAKSEGSGGSVSGSTVYLENETATVTAEEDTLGVFQGWYENGAKVCDNKAYTFTATANRTLIARFVSVNCIHEKDSSYLIPTAKQNASCTEAGYNAYYQCSKCSKYFSDAKGETEISKPVAIDPLGHSWGLPTYSWSEDNATVTATRVCANDESHIETETVNTSSDQTTAPTCTEKGETTYTASFTNTAFETQTKTVDDIKALGHDFGKNEKVCKRCKVKNPNYISPEDAALPTDKKTEEVIKKTDTDKKDVKGSEFKVLKPKATAKKKTITLTWKKVKGADGYIIYGAQCGKDMKKLKTIKNAKTVKYTFKKLKKGKYYKYIIAAYKTTPDGKKRIISKSKSVHCTTDGGKKGNPSKITVKKNKLTVKKGKTVQISGRVKSKPKMAVHINVARFESSNTKIATVDKNGKVKGKKKGTATIYVIAQNGIYTTVKVKVK